ncbi:MAG: pyrroline-5-carboxylate reductase family protein [Thermodesulfobacteriota bacterium]
MESRVGFIGGGRITRIILKGLERAGAMPADVVVSDPDAAKLHGLEKEFPCVAAGPNTAAAACDIVFLSVPAAVMDAVLDGIKGALEPGSVLVSLVPGRRMSRISEMLGGFQRVVRMTPNAPSIVNSGYNPVAFSGALTQEEKGALKAVFERLGACPEVPEEDLEAYSILTAIGPTYLWFQLFELAGIATSLGLGPREVEQGLAGMVTGTVETMRKAGLTPAEVMDLVAIKPLGDEEERIKGLYRTRLVPLHERLKGA